MGGVALIGFQIVSMMVVLGIPTATGVFAADNPSSLATVQQLCMADLKTVEVAAESYRAVTGVFPGAPSRRVDRDARPHAEGRQAQPADPRPHRNRNVTDQPADQVARRFSWWLVSQGVSVT